MSMTLILYSHAETHGITTHLSMYDYGGAYEYNGVDFSMPRGEIKLNLADRQNITHFAALINLKVRIFKITGIKAVNGTVTTYTYELDYLKDYYMNTNESALNTCPIVKEFGPLLPLTRPSNWARWRDDPSYPSMGGCRYVVSDGKYTPGYMNALVVNNGIDHACRPNVYLLGLGDTQTLINYLNTSPYAAAFYKQIVGFYLVPCLAGDWAGASDFDGRLLGSFTAINEPLTFTTLDDNGNTVTETVSQSVTRLNITGDVYTCIYTNIDIELQSFLDIYHTRYTMYIPYVGNVDIPIKAWAKVAIAQTTSLELPIMVTYHYNFYDGTFVMSFESPINKIYTNPTLTPCLYREQIPMPSIALPSGATAFSLYSNKLSFRSQVASTAIQGAVAAASGNLPGVAVSAVNVGLEQYRAELKNDAIIASGQSYGACNGYLGSTLNRFTLVKISELFYQTYVEYAGMNGFIPLNQQVNPNDDYSAIVGRCVIFDTSHIEWHRTVDDDYPATYFDAMVNQINGKTVYFNDEYVPAVL